MNRPLWFFKSLFLACLLILTAAFNQGSPGKDAFLNIDDAQMTKTPDFGHSRIYELVENAKSSIHMMIYHLSDELLIEKLILAKQRGVDVTIILDNQSVSNSSGKLVLQKLLDGGVTAIKSSKAFSISHVKSFCVDHRILFVSTMNFIKNHALMRDFGLTTSEPSLITEFEAVFAMDIENAKTNSSKTPPLSAANLVWSPINARDRLTALIDSAQSEVEVMVENLTDAYVIASLGNAAKRGISVKLLTPQCVLGGAYNNERALKLLTEVGVDTRVMPTPATTQVPYMHAKTLSIDGELAFLGSENYSLNSLSYAREFGIIFKNKEAIKFLHETFAEDWQKSVKYSSLPEGHCSKFMPSFGD